MSRGKSLAEPFIGSAKLPPPPGLMKSSSKKLAVVEKEDPFLAAYIECTKSVELPSTKRSDRNTGKVEDGSQTIGRGIKAWMNKFSCKNSSCRVKEGGVVEISHLRLHRRSRPVKNPIYNYPHHHVHQ